jgi:hypothetical protein
MPCSLCSLTLHRYDVPSLWMDVPQASRAFSSIGVDVASFEMGLSEEVGTSV